jgi:hypothetical protein
MPESRSLVTVAGVSHICRGQDGRVVKAGALGNTHDLIAWDRTCPSSDHKKAHRGEWCQSHVLL